jgi:hypothetical protein
MDEEVRNYFMMFEKAFLTGCDVNTEWMLKWWFTEYSKHNDTPVIFADFGLSPEMREYADKTFDHVFDLPSRSDKNWFLKPAAMIEASRFSKKTCWIDTDCHVLQSISGVFDHSEPNKLGMVEDRPWSKRRGETWHNSGIVLFEGTPRILKDWKKTIDKSPIVGDQEVLHAMLREDSLKRRIYIEDLPQEYNWLRLQLLDGRDSKNKKVMHWTGHKGKIKIREMIRNG